ncbi:hypothetical protein OC835_007486 [Tilletia horrida]|nr:hypothetical protein OC835_007486 [Tilletia horrida]
MSLPPKHRMAFGQWPLANDQSNHTWLKSPDKGASPLESRLLPRGGTAFQDGYQICDNTGQLLKGKALRDAVLKPAHTDSEGVQLYRFIKAEDAQQQKLQIVCAICPTPTSFKNIQHFKKHFARHPTTIEQSSTSSNMAPTCQNISASEWGALQNYFKSNLVGKLRQMIQTPANLPHFNERAEAKEGEFEMWQDHTHAGYLGPIGEDRIQDWIHIAMHRDISRALIHPLTKGEFVRYILMPIVATGLIQKHSNLETWAQAAAMWSGSRPLRRKHNDDGCADDGDAEADDEESEDGDGDDQAINAEAQAEGVDSDFSAQDDHEDDGDDEDDSDFEPSSGEDEDFTEPELEDLELHDSDELSYAVRKARARIARDERDALVAKHPEVLQGVLRGWPQTMDQDTERQRFKKMHQKLKSAILNPSSIPEYDKLVAQANKAGTRKARAAVGADRLHYGMYGPRWGAKFASWIREDFSEQLEQKQRYNPFSVDDFVLLALSPFASVLMIADRLNIPFDLAKEIEWQSCAFGELVYPADDILTESEEEDDGDDGSNSRN